MHIMAAKCNYLVLGGHARARHCVCGTANFATTVLALPAERIAMVQAILQAPGPSFGTSTFAGTWPSIGAGDIAATWPWQWCKHYCTHLALALVQALLQPLTPSTGAGGIAATQPRHWCQNDQKTT